VAGKSVRDVVVREPETIEVVLVQVEEIARRRPSLSHRFRLIDGDVDAVVVEKYATVGEAQDAVVPYLQIVDGARDRTRWLGFRLRT